MKSLYQPPAPDSVVFERDIPFIARDGFQLRAHVFEPIKAADSPTALVVYYHGGGFTIGSPEDTATSCRQLVGALGVTCIAPSYRLGPENPFPTGMNDAWDGLQWIAVNAESKMNVSLEKGFVVGGSSAGGSITAVLSHVARDENFTPAITGTFLLAPQILLPDTKVDLPDKYKSMYLSRTQDECRQDPVLTPALKQIFAGASKGDPQSPWFVPYIWPTGHKGLPKTYLQICGMDVLRDEGLIYEEELKENEVDTKLDIYPGMPHTFWGAFPFLTQGNKAAADLISGIQWLME